MIEQKTVSGIDTPAAQRIKMNANIENALALLSGYSGPNNCIWLDKDGYPSIMGICPAL